MATNEEMTALLKEAEKSYHDLVLGVAPKVIVHQNGQRVEYNVASLPRLKAYIAELKGALGLPSSPRPPMRVWF